MHKHHFSRKCSPRVTRIKVVRKNGFGRRDLSNYVKHSVGGYLDEVFEQDSFGNTFPHHGFANFRANAVFDSSARDWLSQAQRDTAFSAFSRSPH
jgi:hypothetical protein